MKTYARVRRPGSSAVVTASAVARRTLAVARHEAAQRDVERDGLGLAGHVDLDRAGQLAEEPRPGVAPAHRLLGEQLLLGLGEQVRAVAADRAQVVAATSEAVGLPGARRRRRRRAPPTRARRRGASSRPRWPAPARAPERAVGGVGGVDREAQVRVGPGAPDQVADRLQLGHRLGEARAVELGHTTRVALREARGAFVGLGEQAVGAVGPVAVNQRLEVPGDVVQVGGGGGHRPHDTTRHREGRGPESLGMLSSVIQLQGSCSTVSERRASQSRGLALCGLGSASSITVRCGR